MEGPEGIEAAGAMCLTLAKWQVLLCICLTSRRGTVTQKGPDQLVAGLFVRKNIFCVERSVTQRRDLPQWRLRCHLDLRYGDINEFLQMSRAELPWVKRCVDHRRMVNKPAKKLRTFFSKVSRLVIFGLTKSSMTKMVKESMAMFALRFTSKVGDLLAPVISTWRHAVSRSRPCFCPRYAGTHRATWKDWSR